MSGLKKTLVIAVIVIAAVGVGWYAYHRYRVKQEMKYPKFYSGNGRLEATEVYVSAKIAGRIDQIFVKEGDLVHKGDKLVQMQTNTLEAQKAATIAQIKACESNYKKSEAAVKLKENDLKYAKYKYDQQKKLFSTNATAEQQFKEAETLYYNALAQLDTAKAEVLSSKAQIEVQKAELQKIEADIDDSLLIAKYDGRVQNLLAHEGEVLSAGGRVMNIIALTDVYMTFFLPTSIAGKVAEGADVKIVLDAAPEYPIPAKVTFIDPVAQFTPKSVETQVEREKLMFRIKASINPELLEKHLELVKTGMPGVAWVKLNPNAKWEDCPGKINIRPATPPAIKADQDKKAAEAQSKSTPAPKAAEPAKKDSPKPADKQK